MNVVAILKECKIAALKVLTYSNIRLLFVEY